ncbi:MAG: hypothetical protein JO206_07105 [Solirubrobacterales bacterium]|nr:hypothetical protein [Solirubrobacterales bacterium]MBV9472721.1 hypothetical protein [Solirubrobacterales bacterium]
MGDLIGGGRELRRLVVLARDDPGPEPGDSSWVLRLVGTPGDGEPAPPGLLELADQVGDALRERYPGWLWRWTTNSGALALTSFPGSVSWWWYTPISEKSCLRSGLIQELYWLSLLRALLAAHADVGCVEWRGSDRPLAAAARAVASAAGREFVAPSGRPPATRGLRARLRRRRSLTRLILRRLAYSGYAATRWLLYRLLVVPRDTRVPPAPDVVFYTRFPRVWDRHGTRWRERMFGTLPEYLTAQGHRLLYLASPYGSLRRLLSERREWRRLAAELPICHLEAALRPAELWRCHATAGLFVRYIAFKRRRRHEPVRWEGVDVAELLWRELDASVWSPELPANLVISRSLSARLRSLPTVRSVFVSFEYQPSERAVAVAAHSRPEITVVGTQAGIYTANQMGWNFYRPELEQALAPGQRHHLPDLICAYGELPRGVFARGLGERRVAAVGGIRYSFTQAHERPEPSGNAVLVATPSARSEAIRLIESLGPALAEMPEVVVSFKFHPLLPLPAAVARLRQRYPQLRVRITDEPVAELLPEAAVMICGATSTAMEAIVHGCMPLVYRAAGELAPNPMLHVPDAAFSWSTAAELRSSIASCIRADERYRARVEAWPRAIAAHLYRIDQLTNRRLYRFVSERGGLQPPRGAAAWRAAELARR